MKHLRKFNENANRPGPNAGSKSITISQDEVDSFSTEPSLQKLIADEKVSVIGNKVYYNDEDTKATLDEYLEVAGKVEESIFSKRLRKFNESNEDEISENEINDFLNNGVRVSVFLTDLLSDTNLILLMTNGEIYERRAGNKKFDIYSSKEEFKQRTGASLDDEYAGNASPALINLFGEVDDYRGGLIEMAYIDSQFDNQLLDSILKNFE